MFRIAVSGLNSRLKAAGVWGAMKRLKQEEQGQGLTEYALILALITLVTASALGALGLKLDEFFQGFAENIPG